MAIPVLLLLIEAFGALFAEDSTCNDWNAFIGKPIIALMISVVVSFFTLGCARGFNKEEINQFMPVCLVATASIILITEACGEFQMVLITNGVDEAVAYNPCR